MARKTHQVEARMISEYMLEKYSEIPYTLNVALGAPSQELIERLGTARALGMVRPYRPAVDALAVLPNHILIVEAKVWNVLNGLAKLPMYKSLVPITPELSQYQPREVLMQLVVGWTNENLAVMAREAGVEVVEFCPPWLKEVVDRMHNYWTSEYRDRREQALKMREYFQVE